MILGTSASIILKRAFIELLRLGMRFLGLSPVFLFGSVSGAALPSGIGGRSDSGARTTVVSPCARRLALSGRPGGCFTGVLLTLSRGANPSVRTSCVSRLGRGRRPDSGVPAYTRVLTLPSVRRVIRTAAVPRRRSWPTRVTSLGLRPTAACVYTSRSN